MFRACLTFALLCWGFLAGVGTAAGGSPTIDLAGFIDCFDGPGSAIPTNCGRSNFHPDTHIDLLDFAVIQRGYELVPGAIPFASETAGQVEPIDDVDEFTFNGVFGATVTVDFVTPTVGGRPDLVVRLDLVRPNGSTATTTASCGTTARLDSVLLDATGVWKVRVRAYESWANCGFGADDALRTGVYTLSVCPSDAPALPIAYGETRSGYFTSEGQIVNFQFSGATGDVVSVMYLGPASTRRVRLYAPNGTLLGTSGSGAGAVINDILLPLSGVYRIAVEAADGQLRGEYSVGLSELADAIPLILNVPTLGMLAHTAEANTFSFEGVFGTTVTVDYSTPMVMGRPDIVARIDLIRPNGSTASSTATCGGKARLDTVPIDLPGTWRVRVRAYESWLNCGFGADIHLITGSYMVTVCPSNAPPIDIAYGQTKSGSFTVDCQIVNYQFDGLTDDVATIMYLGPAYTRRVRLFAPNGSLLATSSGGQGVSLTDIVLPLDGLYYLAVEAADHQPVGDFSLGLSRLGAAIPIERAVAVGGTLGETAEADLYDFPGTFGSTATVDYSTPSVIGRPDVVVRLDLIRPNGTTAASTATCGNNIRLDTVALDATGIWKIRVRAYESWLNCGYGPDVNLLTGGYTLALCTSDAPATDIAYGETRDASFVVDCEIVNFQFTGFTGDSATIVYFGAAYTRRLQLFAPNGSLLATSGGGQGTSLNDVLLPADGVYRIAVEAADNQAVGDFSIGLSRLGEAEPIPLDTSTAGTLTLVGESDAYTFDGTFGTTVNVDYSTTLLGPQPDIVARIDLIRPNGTLAASTATCGGNARIDTVLLDATGTWTVRIRAYESWLNCGFGAVQALLTGSYFVAVSASDSPATVMGYGETASGEFVVDSQILNFTFAGSLGDLATALYYGPAYLRRIQLFAPNGTLLATSAGGLGAAILDIPLPISGTYRLAAEAADNQPVGAFSVGLMELGDAAPLTLNVSTPGTINAIGQARQYSLARTNGDIITVDYVTSVLSGRPDVAVRLDLVRPDGTMAPGTASCSGTARINNFTIDQTGVWTVRVRAYESWPNCGFGPDTNLLTGSFSVKVCPGACP